MSWAFRKRVASFFRSSLWVVPAFSTVGAFLSVPLLQILDRIVGFPFFRYTPDGARTVTAIVSGAMLSFVVLFFSVLLLTLQIVSSSLSPRVIKRPVYGGTKKFQDDPHWRDYIPFYEYFHGDNGSGLGASYQTGCTGVITRSLDLFARLSPADALQISKADVVARMTRDQVAG
jgi:hypothetical protein